MPWYVILLIVVVCIVGLLFLVFITNGDGKMIEKVYDMLSKYHDEKDKEIKI